MRHTYSDTAIENIIADAFLRGYQYRAGLKEPEDFIEMDITAARRRATEDMAREGSVRHTPLWLEPACAGAAHGDIFEATDGDQQCQTS